MEKVLINGNEIALELKAEIKAQVKNYPSLSLAVFVINGDQASEKYTQKKKKFGEEVGINVDLIKIDPTISEKELEKKIKEINIDDNYQGIIIQLPLPNHINTENILKCVDPKKDVDALGDKASVLSPVVGSISYIFEKFKIDFTNKKVVVVGFGQLVGQPTVIWLKSKGITPEVVDKNTPDLKVSLKDADIIISGAGSPGLITQDIVKEGVIIIDAATSEDSGRLVGDASPLCVSKASLFTPVPGGIGPITIAIIFKNLLTLLK